LKQDYLERRCEIFSIWLLKKILKMPRPRLQQFDGTMIEVEVPIGGELRQVCGRAEYVKCDPELGAVLKIFVAEPMGELEILLPELTWQGRIESSDMARFDYRMSLGRVAN